MVLIKIDPIGKLRTYVYYVCMYVCVNVRTSMYYYYHIKLRLSLSFPYPIPSLSYPIRCSSCRYIFTLMCAGEGVHVVAFVPVAGPVPPPKSVVMPAPRATDAS